MSMPDWFRAALEVKQDAQMLRRAGRLEEAAERYERAGELFREAIGAWEALEVEGMAASCESAAVQCREST